MIFFLFFLGAFAASQWVVELDPGITPREFATEHKLRDDGVLEHLSDKHHTFHLFSETQHTARDVHEHIASRTGGAAWAERQVERRQYKRNNDPLYASQWHLHSHPYGVEVDFAANVTGKGIVIGVVDDGLQHTHPDIRDNYDALNSHDYNDGGSDPSPRDSRDGHGTAAAGVAAATAYNGHCGRGVAYRARLAGIRTIAGPISDLTESRALTHNAVGGIDIFSCSWGPQDDGQNFGEAGFLVRRALAHYVGRKHGRTGKGSIYVWAAGNGRQNGDSCAFDGYANSPYVFPIGALDHEGKQSWYSEGCAALMAVAPSSGANRGITTVDLVGNAGYNPTECTATFGGTSSAAPLAAGIIAALLEERPDLTWRDVKHVIARGATLVDPLDADWHTNAAGFHHSHKYGFGLLKLPPLLSVARAHRLVPATQMMVILPDEYYVDAKGMIPFQHTFVVSGRPMSFVEHVMVKLNVLHQSRGDVKITLSSPEGTVSTLAAPRPNDRNSDYPAEGWSFTSTRHWGETHINGDWVLSVTDVHPENIAAGTVTRVQFYLFGY